MPSCLVHTGDESVTLSAATVKRLLDRGDGDAALLYLALLRRQGTVPPRSLFCRVQSVPFLVGENWLFGFPRKSGGGG